MRWPIRNQILVPFVIIQLISLIVLTLTSASFAVRQAKQNLNQRLNNVLASLEEATFPLTPAVLDKLHSLSEAHFIVWNDKKKITLSTLQNSPEGLAEIPENLNEQGRNFVNQQSVIQIGEERFFAGHVRWRRGFGIDSVLVLYSEQNWQETRWQAIYPSLGVGMVMMSLIILASYWISSRIGNRIYRLQNQVSRIALGEFEPVKIESVTDELKDLAEDINKMASALKTSLQQMKETDRAALITQLASGLAHHLRNSITGARISIQLHQSRCETKLNDESLTIALRQLDLVEAQINGLLRLTRGEERTSFPASIEVVLEETVSLISPIFKHKKIDFQYSKVETDAQVKDGDGVRAAILNLLMNAIEAAGPQGEVKMELSLYENDRVLIEVSDNGPGVSAEIENEIFQPFFSTKKEGIGIGLALADQAARNCAGTLSLKHKYERTIFSLILAITQPESVIDANPPLRTKSV